MPDSVSTSVKRVLNLVSESVFVVALVLATLLVTIGMISRTHRLSNVAAYLPVETEALVVANLENYDEAPVLLSEFMGQALVNYDWFARDVALAWVDGEMIQFIDVNSRSQAQNFMDSLMIEDEVMIDHVDYKCFEVSQPQCYRFEGGFLVLGTPEALDLLEPGLEGENKYQNVRHRLSYNSSLFAYVDTKSISQSFLASLGDLSIVEPGYMETVLRIFPAYGASVKMKNNEWTSETFIPVDKEALGNVAFLHPNIKFTRELAKYSTEGFQYEWSGVEMWTQVETLVNHVDGLNPAAAIVLDENVHSLWKTHFGEASLDDFGTLFDQEQYLAWSTDEDFLWMLKIDSEEDHELALSLKDFFLEGYTHTEVITNESGEQIARNKSLSATKETYKGDAYFKIDTGYYIAVLDEIAITTDNETLFFSTLDKFNGRTGLRSLDEVSSILLGADHFLRLDMTIFPESHIIHLLLPKVTSSTFSVKVFDDGIYNRSILQF